MMLDLLIIAIWGGMVALDTTATFQFLISHPLVSCAIIGAILGNFPLGFIVGILMELIWIGELPVGAAFFSEGNIGATSAAAIAIITVEKTGYTVSATALSLIIGILISYIGGTLTVYLRNYNNKIYQSLINKKHLSITQINRTHLLAVAFVFSGGFILTLVSVFLFGHLIVPRITTLFQPGMETFLKPVQAIFLGISCAVLVNLLITKKNWWLLILGLFAGVMVIFLV